MSHWAWGQESTVLALQSGQEQAKGMEEAATPHHCQLLVSVGLELIQCLLSFLFLQRRFSTG